MANLRKRRNILIYGMRRPGTVAIRYVGQTVRGFAERLSRHISRPHTEAMANWLNELKKDGLKPEMITLAVCTIDSECDRWHMERDWIASLSVVYGPLLINEFHRGDYVSSVSLAESARRLKKRIHADAMQPIWEERRRKFQEWKAARDANRVFVRGKQVDLTKHAKTLGITRQRLDQRIKKCRQMGWNICEALNTPAGAPMPSANKAKNAQRHEVA